MNPNLVHDDRCPLCHRPLRIEYGHTQRSAQQDYPARTWIAGRRCAGCESTCPQQIRDVMRAFYES